MYSVELVLDDATAGRIRAQWNQLVAAGLPSQARHPGASNRPHVTIALTGPAPTAGGAGFARALAALPLPVTVGGLLLFGARRFVLARLVVPSAELLDVQRRVLAALTDALDPHRTFAAGRWTPHVTLARRLTADQVGSALTALGESPALGGELVGARQWDIQAKQEQWLTGEGGTR
jgi:2'-5' RNA ligase